MESESSVVLYHGTNTVVKNPEIRVFGYNKDFGFGFYCTRFERQAQRWAISKRNPHIVCVYEYTPDTYLSVKVFPEMTDEWLDFVAERLFGHWPNSSILPTRYFFVPTEHLRRSTSNLTISYEQQVLS